MHRAILPLVIVSAFGSAAMAQDVARSDSEIIGTRTITRGAADKDGDKYISQWDNTDMARRHRTVGEKAVRSMCVECLGLRYNKPGPRTPLILPEELSNYQGEPQLEHEP
jgi:hypothetical protein